MAADAAGGGARPGRAAAGSFGCHAAAFGTTTSLALLGPRVAERADLSRPVATAVTVLPVVLVLVLSAPMGRVSDRSSAPLLVGSGAVVGTAALLVLAVSDRGMVQGACAAVVGVAASLLFVPSLRAVGAASDGATRSRWVAVATLGTPVSSLVVPPVVLLMADRQGTDAALVLLAGIFAVLGVAATGLIASAHVPTAEATVGDAVDESGLAWVAVVALAVSFAYYVPLSQFTAIARSVGVSAGAAAGFVAALGAGNLVGRLGAGRLLSSGRGAPVLPVAAALVGVGVLALAPAARSTALLVVATACYAVGAGAVVVALPVEAMARSGASSYGAVLGVIYRWMAVGAFVGPVAVSVALAVGPGAATVVLGVIGLLALVGPRLPIGR